MGLLHLNLGSLFQIYYKKMSNLFLKLWPYIACIFTASIFFVVGNGFVGDVKGLLHNISATFLAIPCLYLIYELSMAFSRRKLNEEIFDYVKVQVDRELLGITNQLMKLVYAYDDRDCSLKGIESFLSLSQKELEEVLYRSEYLGFQTFKHWTVSKTNLTELLRNPLVIERLEDDQVICIIRTLKGLRDVHKKLRNSARTGFKGICESGMLFNNSISQFLDFF